MISICWSNASVCWSNTHHVRVISSFLQIVPDAYPLTLSCSAIPPCLLFNSPVLMSFSCAHLNYSHMFAGYLASFPPFPVLQLDKEFLLFQQLPVKLLLKLRRWPGHESVIFSKSQMMFPVNQQFIYSHAKWFFDGFTMV